MGPRTKQQRQHNGQDRSHPTSGAGPAQHTPPTRSVDLGVMYPSAVAQPSKVTPDKQSALPVDIAVRQTSHVIFYDPFAAEGRDERIQEQRATRTTQRKLLHGNAATDISRLEAIDAVASDLKRLQSRNRSQQKWTAADEEHNGMD